jgi:outer membrane protein OmpA-like peptidoglycan-associated protein
MEYIMSNNRYFSLSLLTVAMLAGCQTVAVKPSAALAAAHQHYDFAQGDANITNLASLEMKQASDTLVKADEAVSKKRDTASIDHLAYLANQQVAIAEATAARKTAEFAVNNAGAKRNEIRLEARTAEVDAARREADRANLKAANAHEELGAAAELANQQAAELKEADAKALRDKKLIEAQRKQLEELNAKQTERGMVITLGDVLFRTDQAALQSGGVHNVQKLADFLSLYPQHKVLIEGYTDSTGSDSHNQALSERRAAAVEKTLIGMGIGASRISVRGYGEKYPVTSNKTAELRQLNRRVEVVISDANGKLIER